MLFTVIIVFVYTLGVLSAFNAIMTARTSQGATAWVISLVTLPYVAVPLYWFFGRNKFNGYTAARKKAEQLVTDRLQNITTQTKNYIPQESSLGILYCP